MPRRWRLLASCSIPNCFLSSFLNLERRLTRAAQQSEIERFWQTSHDLSRIHLDSGKIPRIHRCFCTGNTSSSLLALPNGHSPEKSLCNNNSDHCANTRPMPCAAWNIYVHHLSNGLEIKTMMLDGAVPLSIQQANGRLSNAFCEGWGHSTLKKLTLPA